MIDENIILRNVNIILGAAEVDNHISRYEIFNYHPIRIFILLYRTLDPLFSTILGLPW